MEHGDGGDSDEEGFEMDYHNDAVRKCVTLYTTKTDATDNSVSDDDLDIEYIDDSVGEAWWHMRRPGSKNPGAPDGSHLQVFPKIGVATNQGKIQVHPPRKTLTTQEIGIYIHTHQSVINSIMCIIKHLPEQLFSQNIP